MEEQKDIILFDGVCNLCNHTVDFIIKRDKKDAFRFAPLQSAAGSGLLKKYHLNHLNNESVILIRKGIPYRKSDAAFRFLRQLPGIWKIFSWGIILPKFMRDGCYDFLARHRYRWFGKRETCRIPSDEERKKFLD